MPDATHDDEIVYHLLLDEPEAEITGRALRLLISDEAHEREIRRLAREVIASLEQPADAHGTLVVSLTPQQMKITHTALRLLLNDLQREQADEIELLRGILDKLPDEHTMRAIELE